MEGQERQPGYKNHSSGKCFLGFMIIDIPKAMKPMKAMVGPTTRRRGEKISGLKASVVEPLPSMRANPATISMAEIVIHIKLLRPKGNCEGASSCNLSSLPF